MKNILLFATCCIIAHTGLFANPNGGGLNKLHFAAMQSDCNDIQAHFTPSKFYSEPGEEVIFTNQSSGYHHCSWYLNNVLVSTSVHWSYTFPADGHYDVRLEVKNEDETCTAVYEIEHHVHSPIHFCGDLVQPDQDPAECPCMTSYDMNENGQMEQKTYYRWRDRWGNKYCNLSVTGDCEDNLVFPSNSIFSVPEPDCIAGYFHLYFSEPTIGGVVYSIPTEQQTLICQVFSDFSELLTPANPNTVVNFRIYPFNDPASSFLAFAGSYYDLNPTINNAALPGLVWSAINTNSVSSNILHGFIELNLAGNYYTGYDPSGISTDEFDMYALIQHEILHTLGIVSFINDYNGSSTFTQNLFTTFDMHLLNDGVEVLTNLGPGMNYQSNSIGNNCNSLRFDNVSVPTSPVNSYLNGDFYSPSHLDDNCTNITSTPTNSINGFYVMNPFFYPNQARRLQQEEVDALCKLGYLISGEYGTQTLVQSGAVNPNLRPYDACSATNSGGHFSANDDLFFTPNQFFAENCIDFTGPYTFNILDNDLFPQGAVLVELMNLQTNALVSASDLLPDGLSFQYTPQSEGIHYFTYRLYYPPTQTFSNYAVVGIYVNFCTTIDCQYSDVSGCNLICNSEFEVSECSDIGEMPANYNAMNAWRATVGTPYYVCPYSPATDMNAGGAMGFYSTTNHFYSGFSGTEFIGQDIILDPNKNYLASFYFSRNLTLGGLDQINLNSNVTIRMEYASQDQLPLNPNSNFAIPQTQDVIYETNPVTLQNEGIWIQAVNTFTPTINGNLIQLGVIPTEGFFMTGHFIDRVELIEDEFTAGEDQIICDDEGATIGVSLCSIENLTYEWYIADANFIIQNNTIVSGTFVGSGSMINVSPSATTSYALVRRVLNLNEAGNNGYAVENADALFAVDYVTVNYLQNTNDPAVFNPIAPLCQNINFSLPTTSTNGISGSWSPTFSSANLGSTTYTFTPNFPCSPTTTMSITIVPCGDCQNSPGIHLSGIIEDDLDPNLEYRIVSDIEIQGTVNFQSCIIAIDPNVSITVPENQNLIISESHLYGCYRMWNGIDVRPNGSLKIQASLIEDAKTAVNMFALDNAVSGWRLKVDESIFNKNQVGIKINGYPFNNSNEVFDISTVAFTCREISPDPNFWPTLSDFITPNPAANAYNFEDPLIDPSVYPSIDPLYILIQNGLDLGFVIPYGIWLNNVGITLNPNATPIFNSFQVGSEEDNLPWVFDKMARGIYAMKSNVQVSRPTIFQSHQELAKVSYGIYAESFIQAPGTQILYNPFDGIIQVGASQDAVQFYNVSCAVYVDDYTHLDVQKCRIRGKRTNAGYLSHLGLNGVRFKTPKAAQFVVKDNQFHNIKDGVFALIGHPIMGTKINLNISDNTFSRILPNATGVISSTAIQISSVSPSSIFYPDPFRIENNTITGTRRGIYLANLDVAQIYVERNAIILEEYIGTAWDSRERFFGINLRTVSSSNSQIYENDIEGFNTVNTQARGIWMDNSTQINVLCNNTKHIGAGLYFYGNCQSRVLQNNMLMNRYGLWLDGQGYIGQQGNANSAAGNTWSGSGATAWTPYQAFQQPPTTAAYRIKTYVSQFTFADQSPMYVLPLSASNPSNSWAAENDQLIPFSLSALPQTVYLSNTLGNPHLCEVGHPVGDDPAGLDAPNGIADFDKFLLALERDAELSAGNTDAPSEVIREQLTYDYLYKNPDIRDSSAVLDSFYMLRLDENVGKLREMNQKLDEKLLDDAEALRNQVIPNNLVELAYREVLDLQLKYERGLFTQADSTDLHLWAESCFYVYGKAIPIAQSLYNLIFGTSILFLEDCPSYLPRSVSLNAPDKEPLDVLLYPNPNSNVLYGKVNEENIHVAHCIIRSVEGKALFEGNFHFLRGIDLNNLALASGVFTIELLFENRDERIIKKLVFIK